jgi:RNA polymerase sigma-32 factor
MVKSSKDDTIYSEIHPLVAMPEDAHLPAVGHLGLHRYLQEISQYKLLTREETEELAINYYETGDPEAA